MFHFDRSSRMLTGHCPRHGKPIAVCGVWCHWTETCTGESTNVRPHPTLGQAPTCDWHTTEADEAAR